MHNSTQRLLMLLVVVVVFTGGLLLGRSNAFAPTATLLQTGVPTATFSTIAKQRVSFASCGRSGAAPTIQEYSKPGSSELFFQISKSDKNLTAEEVAALSDVATYIGSGKAADLEKALPQLFETIQPACVGGLSVVTVLKTEDKNGSSVFDQAGFLDKVTDPSFKGRAALVAKDSTSMPSAIALQLAATDTEVLVDYVPAIAVGDPYYAPYLKACGAVVAGATDAQMEAYGSCAAKELANVDWQLPSDLSVFGEFYKASH